MNRLRGISVSLIVALVVLAVQVPAVFANGTETLGAPDITIATGSGYVAAGTGMFAQPGTVDLDVPAGATIKQVLLYWAGHSPALPGTQGAGVTGDSTLTVDGVPVAGTLIGGPTFFFYLSSVDRDFYTTGFRADITGLGLVSNGANQLTIDNLDFGNANGSGFSDGAGIIVIFDDGTEASIQVRDGVDVAFLDFPGTRQVTVAQTFTFDAADVDRVADLKLLVGSVGVPVSASVYRPNAVLVHIDGNALPLFVNVFKSADGEEWDTTTLGIPVPAGATSMTVQLLSYRDGSSNLPASLTWVAAGLALPEVTPPDAVGTRTIGYWKTHASAWPVEEITIGGVTYSRSAAIAIMNDPSPGDKTIDLAKQLIGSKLNVISGAESSCIDGTIAQADAWLVANPAYSGVRANHAAWKNGGSALMTALDNYNNGLLCAPKAE